jgi:hypothetical protein
MPQSIPKGLNREHVIKALADLDAGIDHPFGKPTKFELVHDSNRYAPKAVVGIAFRHLTGEILHHREFSGGEAPGQANYELRRLGFKIEEKPKESVDEGAGNIWTPEEVGLLITDYFDMLQLDLTGQQYNKAEHNRQLREALADRSKPSVEFKHRNVSAVLLKLGLPYIDGYKPAKNFQRSLVDNVREYLDSHPALFTELGHATDTAPDQLPKLESLDRLFEAPPDDTPLPDEPPEPWRSRKGQKIDFVRRDASNRRLGRLGEEFAVELERRRLTGYGRDDLAKKVEWVSDTSGDGLGFDVLSFDEVDDSERLIEVKTTKMGKYFPFFVTSNEVRCSEAMARQYHLYRLFRFSQRPRLYVLHGALSDLCRLEPVSYRATVTSKEAPHDG